jgi:alkylhydroperoxidase family enzyme
VANEKLVDIGQYQVSEHYTERERLALRYADKITLSDEDVDDTLFAQLREHYSSEELVELTFTVAYENFLSKFHHALLVESQGFCPVAARPSVTNT